MSTTTTPTTLLTGSNGAIGFPILLHALAANHTVHAVLRTPEKASQILSSKSISSLPASTRSRLHTVIIPDLLSPTAYDEVFASHKIDYVIHVASPIPGGGKLQASEYESGMIRPAIDATMNLLEAAERAGVKRVVITSSVVAMLSTEEFRSENNENVYTEKSRAGDPTGPITDESTAYQVSKIKALNAAEEWADDEGKGRRTEVVYVHPAFVLGSVELAGTKEELLAGSSGMALSMALGEKPPPRKLTSITCSLEDVAEVHVRAVDRDRVPNGQSLVVVGDGVEGMAWKDGKAILEKVFPKAVEKGVLKNKGWAETTVVKFDVRETERLVGMKFGGFERQIVDVAGRYLDVVGAARE